MVDLLTLIILLLAASAPHGASACADFVFLLNASPNATANQNLKEAAQNIARNLEIDSGLHRTMLLTSANVDQPAVYDFQQFTTTEQFVATIGQLNFSDFEAAAQSPSIADTLTLPFVTGPVSPAVRHHFIDGSLDEELERVAVRAATRRRNQLPVVLILLDDGAGAFAAAAPTLGRFATALHKRHYLHFYVVSPKAERIRNALQLSTVDARLVVTKEQQLDALAPFVKCASRLANNEFRRRAPPSAAAALPALAAGRSGPMILAAQTFNAAATNNNNNNLRFNTQQRFVSNNNNKGNNKEAGNNVSLSNYLFRNHSFSQQVREQQQQRRAAAASPPPTQPPSTVRTTTQRPFTGRPGCQFDIVLLMDFSGGAADKRQRYLALAADLIRALDIGEFASQVAAIRYSGPGRSDTLFRLKKHRTKETLLDELLNAPPLGGTTRTGEALLYAKQEFAEKYGGRGAKAERILVLFTDGYSQDDASDGAIQLKQDRIHVYTVAVEDVNLPPNLDVLRAIAFDRQSALLDAQFGVLTQKLASSAQRCRQ